MMNVRRLIACGILILAGCSNDPGGKENALPNAAINGATNGATNGTTNSNSGECIDNNVVYPDCPTGTEQVSSCPDGQECATIEGYCNPIICVRSLTPASWTQSCEDDPDCAAEPSGCDVDEDCAVVPRGDFCGCLECPDGGIERGNEAAYLDALEAARSICGSQEPCGDVLCVETLPHCDLQTSECVAREAKYITTTGLPDDCEVASDCVAVFAGEVCDACMCPNEAIPVSQQTTYQSAFDVECAHGVACDCAAYEVACNEGMCELLTP